MFMRIITGNAFQSTPPHGGRPIVPEELYRLRFVSIHAPARGATEAIPQAILAMYCFNPRPRTGGDQLDTPGSHRQCGFNPRPRTGGDIEGSRVAVEDLVSIHAPARGATSPVWLPGASQSVSIHAPARGATSSTLEYCESSMVSIHAPARGATPIALAGGKGKIVSIHAPARGATLEYRCVHTIHTVSIHAPARGATWWSSPRRRSH